MRVPNWMRLGGFSTGLAAMIGLGCAAESASFSTDRAAGDAAEGPGAPVQCGDTVCPDGFVCEFGECVPETPPPQPASGEPRDPLASERYVFSLDPQRRRLVRIDSAELTATAFSAGLGPMDLAVLGGRDLTVLLDAFDLVEIMDHRAQPPTRASFDTARSLSHLAASPTGQHVVAYYDWDDPRAQTRQPDRGNINKISVLFTGETDAPMAEGDARVADISVGFLPRDVRFAADGSRVVVIARDSLTPIQLTAELGNVATPEADIGFAGEPAEILINAAATEAVLRYPETARVDVLSLADGGTRCVATEAAATDVAFDGQGRLLVVFETTEGGHALGIVALADAAQDCGEPIDARVELGPASRIRVDRSSDFALGYAPDLAVEQLRRVNLRTEATRTVALEKAVGAVAFVGDGEHAYISHLAAPGEPAWDPQQEDPDTSVDKAFGVGWVHLPSGAHHLAVSDAPFGPFTFVPGASDAPGATYQAVLDQRTPKLLRIAHAPGFEQRWVELAAEPLSMGFLAETERAYVTQVHPWGRITFLDARGESLRHVSGFALQTQ